MEYYVALSLYLGCDIISSESICNKCKQKVDKKGYHALHCKWGGQLIQRHNAIRNELNKCIKSAGFITRIEQKYKEVNLDVPSSQNDDAPSSQNERVPSSQSISTSASAIVKGIPGDIKILKWDNVTGEDLYLDIVVGNIFAKSYVDKTSKTRLWLATEKERVKLEKYHHKKDVKPMALETMGAMGNTFKNILQIIADRIATRRNQPYSIVMNRIRTRLIAILMKYNCNMILSSIYT